MIVYLDTNCIIYVVENHPVWCPKVLARITSFRSAGDEIAAGDLARAECLVVPFKNGDLGLEARYRAFFDDPDIHVLGISSLVCERAARIRAADQFKLPDALHLATAVEQGCGLSLTADAKLGRCGAMKVEVLT